MITEFKSNETVPSPLPSSDEEDDSISLMSIRGISDLIPPFVLEICKNPNSVELKVNFDAPTMQSMYTYTITWEDEEKSEGKYRQVLEKKMSSTNFEEKISSLKTSKSKNSLSNRTYSDVHPVTVPCDGPCKKEFPSNLLNTMGRCEHYLCVACFGIVKNSDGTNGCSSAHCNWKGETRKEAKKFFEKEICQKQRVRARELRNLRVFSSSSTIDVKSATTVSDFSTSSSSNTTSPNPEVCSDETDCSILPVTSFSTSSESSDSSKFELTFPSKEELIGVKLVILEPNGENYMRKDAKSEFISNQKINKVISDLILQKFESIPRNHRGVLYHVELQPNWSKKVRRVRTAKYDTAAVYDFSQIADYIVFLLDFGGFMSDGMEVNVG